MGHVLLVVSEPSLVQPGSSEAELLEAEWGHRGLWPLVRVSTLESTRDTTAAGLHEAELYLHVSEETGKAQLVGEFTRAGGYIECDDNAVEVWRAPPAVRNGFRLDIMAEVLREMCASMTSWSLTTAARAVLRSADVSEQRVRSASDAFAILRELRTSWGQDPICTSVVIGFWQRYLCMLAGIGPSARELPRQQEALCAVDLVLQVMPLLADRALPSELRTVLKLKCGWQIQRSPGRGRLARFGRNDTF